MLVFLVFHKHMAPIWLHIIIVSHMLFIHIFSLVIRSHGSILKDSNCWNIWESLIKWMFRIVITVTWLSLLTVYILDITLLVPSSGRSSSKSSWSSLSVLCSCFSSYLVTFIFSLFISACLVTPSQLLLIHLFYVPLIFTWLTPPRPLTHLRGHQYNHSHYLSHQPTSMLCQIVVL